MPAKFYLRSTVASPSPTSGEKSSVLPVGTLKDGTPTERSLLEAKGSSGASIVVPALNQTAHQDIYHSRFSSPPVFAGTYGSGSWTFAVQSQESNTNANAFHTVSLYFWRPSNNSVVGYIYDSDSTLGVEVGNNSTNRYGQVLSFSGSDVTAADGDILVLEVWFHETQSMGGTYNHSVHYDGTTDVTATYNGTDPASYLTAPANIPLLIGPTGAKTVVGVSRSTVKTVDGVALANVKTVLGIS